ncbi:MAG: hypothetical protein Kow0022_18250 [Phycisphaerales bacterium]
MDWMQGMASRTDYNQRPWIGSLVLVGLGAAAFPFDGPISRWAVSVGATLGGDLRRELEAFQQYGQFGCLVIVGVGLALLQPWRARRLVDLGAAAGLTWIVTQAVKMLVGRPRPKFADPGILLGPFGQYPVDARAGIRHAWEFWAPISSDLWSMPSSHTAFAVMLSVFLSAMAPRLRPLVVVLAAIVGMCRVLFGAHYLSDVLVGAGVGLVVSSLVVRHSAGVRGLDWIWKRVVDPGAAPAYPGLVAAEQARLGGD